MQSQRHVCVPLYHNIGQVGPRFGDSGSLVEWKSYHNLMVEADIHLRPLHTSILDIYKVFQPLVCCIKGIWVHPYHYISQVGPRFGKSGLLVEWEWCNNHMVEADFHLRLLHTSILDIYKVFEPLVCCLKGVWVHPYTVTLAKLAPAPDLWTQGHL